MHGFSAAILFSVILTTAAVSSWWVPPQYTTWQIQRADDRAGRLDKGYDVDMYDVDLFDTPVSDIRDLQKAGTKVMCYFSAGSYEHWRPDADQFPESVLGRGLSNWDERWLDIRSQAVRDIMKARMDKAVRHHCDGIDPSGLGIYTLKPSEQGFSNSPIDADDQLDYSKFIAHEAHKRHLSVGLNQNVGQIRELQPYFDWAINESCMDYDECSQYAPFLHNRKAVFHIQISSKDQGHSTKLRVCSAPSRHRPHQFMTLIKEKLITAWRLAC